MAGALLFLVVILANGLAKPDYDPVHDFVSEGAIGRGGWLQIGNFIVSGALLTVFSFGLRDTVTRWTSWLVRVFAVCLMAAGVFVADPVPSDAATGHGIAHNAVSLAVFVALVAACCTAARWQPTRAWRWYCLLSAALIVVFFVLAGGADPVDGGAGLFQRASIAAGWIWLAALARRALRFTAQSR